MVKSIYQRNDIGFFITSLGFKKTFLLLSATATKLRTLLFEKVSAHSLCSKVEPKAPVIRLIIVGAGEK